MANARVETVRGLAAARFDWEQALRDLSRAMPADVKLQSLNGDMGLPGHERRRRAIRCAGRSRRRRSASRGCAPSQPSVARHDVPPARRRRRDARLALEVGEGHEAATAGRRLGRVPARARTRRRSRRSCSSRARLRSRRWPRRRQTPPPRRACRSRPRSRRRPARPAADAGSRCRRRRRSSGDRRLDHEHDHHDDPRSRCPVTRSPKILIPAVAAIAAVAAFCFLVAARPSARRPHASTPRSPPSSRSSISRSPRRRRYEKAQGRTTRTNYTTLTRLGKAVPADDDVRSLLVQINDAADRAEGRLPGDQRRRRRRATPTDERRQRLSWRPRPAPCPWAAPASPRCRSASASRAASSGCRTSSTGSRTS